jgi:hypothetical protein
MESKIVATIEKYGYLKTPQFWVNIKTIGTDGGSRIGPFKSLKQCGNFLRTYPAEMPVTLIHYLGWDSEERMIRESVETYNFKAFGA